MDESILTCGFGKYRKYQHMKYAPFISELESTSKEDMLLGSL